MQFLEARDVGIDPGLNPYLLLLISLHPAFSVKGLELLNNYLATTVGEASLNSLIWERNTCRADVVKVGKLQSPTLD